MKPENTLEPKDSAAKNADGHATPHRDEGWIQRLRHIRVGAKMRAHKAFPIKFFLFGLAALIAGALIFALAPGNEPLTFLGFALVLGGLLIPAAVTARRILRKIYLWIPAGLVLFVILLPATLAAYVVFFFPNELVRQIAQAEMSKALMRPVSIGYLNVTILKGIRVSNLVINDRGSDEQFVSAGLTLSYDLLPLLVGHLRVNRAILESPTIHIRRTLYAGRAITNIDDLLEPGEEPIEEPADTELPVLPFFISVGEVGLRNGSITVMDRGTPGFANEYILDQLDCIISDLTWPIVQPLGVRFNFRVAMQQLDVEDGKTFNLVPGITGRALIRYINGEMVPEGGVDFVARDGEFYGQQFLTAGQDFLETLKRGFFEGIHEASVGNLDEFENALLTKTAGVANTATGRINDIVNSANRDFESALKKLENSRLLATSGFDTSAKKESDALDSDANTLVRDTRTTYDRLLRAHPAAAQKLNVDTYINSITTRTESVRSEYASFILAQAEELNAEITAIIETEQRRHNEYISALQGNLDTVIERYAGSVRNQFLRQIGRVENFVDSFDLDIPFLSKRMTFDRVSTLLSSTNGVMHFSGLTIHGKEFTVGANGSYNLINDDINVRLRLALDRRFASNAIMGLFLNTAGVPELEIEVATRNGRFHFALLGDPIPKRMGAFAANKAKEFMHDFIDKNVTADSFLASLRAGGGHDGADNEISAAKQRRLFSVSSEKTRRKQLLANEGKEVVRRIEEDIRRAVAGNLPGLPHVPGR
jgi:hypothetical protein